MRLGPRALQKNHRLQLVVSLVLPESDYNRKLGMFQVRAELLSASGKVTHSSSQPCMLRFKSPHIRFVETFLRTGTLLAGYSSESQIINIKMTGFVEGNDPTVCVRIIIEQRAEYKPGAGIPEIYAASLKLESQLPLMKRMIWNWRITIFIWVVMTLFVFELLIVLVCCRPLIIPRTRTNSETPNRLPDGGTSS
ncbi:uncharacterized protein A4U43_C01F16040 [Asparagus officinalis]|uniref:Seipin n=1 Tax=Asparagus officinalis TaxID=4686 RepID=A0A5P1FPQ6_ASPOF|nr:uncharacterized protein A4U43_C01F16040 [Asparagus officinalis]